MTKKKTTESKSITPAQNEQVRIQQFVERNGFTMGDFERFKVEHADMTMGLLFAGLMVTDRQLTKARQDIGEFRMSADFNNHKIKDQAERIIKMRDITRKVAEATAQAFTL